MYKSDTITISFVLIFLRIFCVGGILCVFSKERGKERGGFEKRQAESVFIC